MKPLSGWGTQIPDVVLLDLNLPGLDGIGVLERLRMAGKHVPVLMLTMHEDERGLRAAFDAGAHGYLLKGSDQAAILAALRTVVEGGVVVGRELADRMTSLIGGTSVRAAPRRVGDLSERETEVLALIAAGRSNTEIVRELVVSAKTVRNHITHIFTKLGGPTAPRPWCGPTSSACDPCSSCRRAVIPPERPAAVCFGPEWAG